MKYKRVILLAIFVGGILAFFFYQDINNEVKANIKKDEVINLFQVGVFKSYDNAKSFANTFSSSLIYETDGYYRVIISLATNGEALGVLEEFFKSEEINYYLKSIRVNKLFIRKMENFENIIVKTNKRDIIYNVNNSMLQLFDSYILKNET